MLLLSLLLRRRDFTGLPGTHILRSSLFLYSSVLSEFPGSHSAYGMALECAYAVSETPRLLSCNSENGLVLKSVTEYIPKR